MAKQKQRKFLSAEESAAARLLRVEEALRACQGSGCKPSDLSALFKACPIEALASARAALEAKPGKASTTLTVRQGARVLRVLLHALQSSAVMSGLNADATATILEDATRAVMGCVGQEDR